MKLIIVINIMIFSEVTMGGGNLNLKKSWHPSTLKNQERVWKAEQQDESEKRKVEELQKELQAQREKEEFQVDLI